MTKNWAALVSVLLLLATPAVAAGWSDNFKACDADGSGTVSRAELNACEAKLDPQMNPTFTTMDTDHNNSVDQAEWTQAEKFKTPSATTVRKPRLPGVRARTILKSRSVRAPSSA